MIIANTRRVWALGLSFPRERPTALLPAPQKIQKIEARPKNWLTPVALVILRAERSHGYELMKRVTKFGFEEINPGTLYRTLKQLAKEGFCKSEWDTSESGPPRRVYSITDLGEEYLAAWAEGCKQYQNIMDCFYRAYTSR